MSAGGGAQQQLQQLSQAIQQVEQEVAELETEIEEMRAEQGDIDEAIEAIETLETGSVVQVPLGGGAYVRATVEDIDEVIVELGGGYAAEQSSGDAVDALERRKGAIGDRIEDVEGQKADLEAEAAELEEEAQQLQGQLQQQQMQNLQQQDEG